MQYPGAGRTRGGVGGMKAPGMPPSSVTLISWGPGDTVVLAPMTTPASGGGGMDSMMMVHSEATEGGMGERWELGEVRMHRPWGLWRYVLDFVHSSYSPLLRGSYAFNGS